ncbi:DUF5977 domain-containing protein [uncultured Flavobacterium sp.]|uniref:DUF5977 domain-containing protein n=1 Tax=uncultured Flavobacterium sp. TaxID=165435 RepID=UPI002931D6B0|nr:DUF5977 domain-containing protein [uncultured Flavobacterium sp.]
MKKILLLVAHISLSIMCCNAQEMPTIMPPSPTAASLGSYGQVPLGLFTGTPQINIPLYDLKAGKLTVPISLSYSSNGIKIDEMASDVGLGWVLNAGGVITRTIMDDPDENQPLTPPNFSDYTPETLSYLQNATNSDDGYDTSLDMFSFNFNGYSGKFYLDSNKVPVLINPSPLKIEATGGTYACKITDPTGVIYWFGSATSTEKIMYRSKLTTHNTWTGEAPTSWYLSKIENPSSGDVITFNYTVSNYSYDAGLSQSVSKSGTSAASGPGQNLVITESRVLGVILSSITSNTGKVSFIYADRDAASNTKKIESIEIEDSNQKSIKKIVLGYNIVTTTMADQYSNPHIFYEPQYGKRLFLTSVTEMNGSVSKPPHLFTYYDYDKIPPRFSYAQDYWGYFNGASSNNYLVSNDDYYLLGSSFSSEMLKNFFADVGGNKKPNGLYSKNGLLKNITYPTGGSNELIYEPHSYYGTKLVYPSKKGLSISLGNAADQFSRSETVTTEIIPYYQEKVPLYFSAGKRPNCGEAGWPDKTKASLAVEVAESGSDVFTTPVDGEGMYIIDVSGFKRYDPSSSVTAAPIVASQHYIDLQPGKKYRFKVGVPFECVRGDFSTSYYDQNPTSVPANIEVGGQRLSKMISNYSSGKQDVKKYYYGTLSCLTCSSGVTESPVPLITLKTYNDWTASTWSGDPTYSLSNTDIISLTSSTLYSLYTKQNSHIGYSSVVEGIGDNFEAGGILHKFTITPIEIAMPLRGRYVPGTPFNTTFDTGNEIETQYFYKNGSSYITTKKVVNTYDINPIINKARFGYSISQRDFYSGSSWTVIDKIKAYDITKYIIRSQWHYLKSTTEDVYDVDGLNPITTKINYNYTNPAHLQISSQTTTDSKQETFETKYYYAQDPEMASQPFVNDLRAANIIIPPLKTQTLIGGSKLSEQLTAYDKSSATSNLLLPRFVYANKGLADIDTNLDKKITYDQYDDKGNILQYTPEGGTPVSIIWGYNKTQPIAKIENTAYSTISTGTITNLQTLSNADNDNCMSGFCTEQLLRNDLNAFRTSLPNAFISTYTYNPSVGVTSITDPKGITSYYEYDALGRLKFVKDKDLNVLQKYCYNYKGQQVDCSDNTSTSIMLYKSVAKSGSFTKNNCAAGGVGSVVVYTVPAGRHSAASQAAADAKAQDDVNSNGQAYANADTNGTCTFSSIAKSGSFTKNNCAVGGVGSVVVYTVPAGKYNGFSQAEADAKAQDDININGLIYANTGTNGSCTFSSIAKSGSFTKNNCAVGGVGSVVVYTVPAGKYSGASQAEADAKAQDDVNNNGLAYANTGTNGTCTFSNVATSGLFPKNNCPIGGIGSIVTYTVPAGKHTSTASQAAADALAQDDINNNGQAYANTVGTATCTFSNIAKSGSFTKNNCAAGGVGSTVVYTVPAGKHYSSSQAGADALAQDDVNNNGQTYANTPGNGICTFSNIATSGSFTRNNCAAGGVGSVAVYTVPAGRYSSTSSQAAADQLARDDVNNNGQAYANTPGNGICTFSNAALSVRFVGNTCPVNTDPGIHVYTVPYGKYTSDQSQAKADQLAQDEVNAYGQQLANEEPCTYHSAGMSGTFKRNNCATGYEGGLVTYTVPSAKYSSTSSQADADNKAILDMGTNGQLTANANGTCTLIPQPVTFQYEYFFNTSTKDFSIDACASGTNHNGATLNFTVNFKRTNGLTYNQVVTVVFPAGQGDKLTTIFLNAASIVSVSLQVIWN